MGKMLDAALDIIGEKGVSTLTRQNLKRIAYPIVRATRKRIRELEAADLTDSPAYRYLKKHGDLNISAAGTNLNKIRHNVQMAYGFLNSKTSTIQGTKEYLSKFNSWVGKETTREEREKIWGLYERLKDLDPSKFFSAQYNSSELEADIYRVVRYLDDNNFDKDDALEAAKREMQLLDVEDNENEEFDILDEEQAENEYWII